MVSEAKFHGGIKLLTLTTSPDQPVNPQRARFWTIIPTTSGQSCQMVDPQTDHQRERLGLESTYLWNAGEDSFTVKDHNGTTIGTVESDEVAIIDLIVDDLGVYIDARNVSCAYICRVQTRAV